MARKRKGSANGKGKDTKNNERNLSTDADVQQEENNSKSTGISKSSDNTITATTSDITTPETTLDRNEEDCPTDIDTHSNDQSQEKMKPLDIQQMILGDLQSEGHGDEIIVSRESAGDNLESDAENVTSELGNVVESPREEEYEIHTEEEDEEEFILMNEEDGEENQYVIVVNSDFEVTDDVSQEVVSIHNLEELQEGSCEIITVVRESDYESSQESVDDMKDEDCDDINAVIGTVDGIHCVKISQYNSDDESSNHDDSFGKETIRVTEHETEVDISSIQNSLIQQVQHCENNDFEMSETGENHDEIKVCSQSKESCSTSFIEHSLITDKSNTLVECSEEENSAMEICRDNEKSVAETIREEESNSSREEENKINVTRVEVNTNMKIMNKNAGCRTSSLGTRKLADLNIDNNYKPKNECSGKSVSSDQISVGNERNLVRLDEISSVKSGNDLISTSNLKKDDEKTSFFGKNVNVKKLEENCMGLPDSSEGCEKDKVKEVGRKIITSNKNLDLNIQSRDDKEPPVIAIKSESDLKNLQEHKVTSNSSVSDSMHGAILQLKDINQLPKEEKVGEPLLDDFCIETSSDKVEDKVDSIVKEELTLKDEEEKQSSFRSRSGSTDTTGSESGSNSSSGRRRSGRIRLFGAMKQNELDMSSKPGSAPSTALVTSSTTPPVPGYELDKPVKVKSRWRRSSELEMGSSNKRQHEMDVVNANARLADSDNTSTPPPRSGQPSTPPDTPPPDKEVEDILTNFQHLDCNEYHTERSRSKEAKRMVCDCMLTKEEIARGDMGCGEDCLNRLLMIECGARCMLGERCANKRFQNLEYAKCEVFKTEMKGCGLRALEDISADTFLLEYVGEVLDPKEFRRRAKDYAKDKNLHYYFMALKSDAIIDATQKGNISRFINHSCDPNAETQKWTVNGELRVGFFSKRPISAGEEITFDYQLQRYGKEAQRCFCQTSQCRGWIGEDPEKENKWSDLSGRNKERRERERKKKEDKRNVKDMLNDIDLEEEIEKLVLKNRAQTLMLCRLMVRAEDHSSRVQLLRILQKGETACLRLFLDYHGLRLIWSWMMDPASASSLRIEILETLAKLPIPNKTMLQDSKVLSVVEKWSTAALTIADAKDRSSTEDESDKAESDKEKPTKGSESEKSSDDSNTSKPVETEEQQEINKKKILEIANSLLKEWASLKEVFRIPKKERIEQMKEHEREADKVCKDGSVEKQDKSYDRHWNQDKSRNDYDRRDRDRDKDRDRERDKDRKRGRDSPDSDKARKSAKVDDRQAQMAKMERRQLFAIKAQQEEEERQRRQQENIWHEQVHLAAQELAAQAHQAQEANNYANYPSYPQQQQWMSFPPPDSNMMPPQHMEHQQMFHSNAPPPFMFNQSRPPLQHPPFLDPNHNSSFHNPVNPMFNHPPPLPKQPLLPTPLPNQPLLPNPNQPLLPTPNQPLLPNPNQPLLPTPNSHPPLLPTPNPHQPLLPPPNQHQPLLPPPNQHQPLLPPNPHQPLLPPPNQHQSLLPPPNQHQPLLHPQNSHQPLLPPSNQPLLHTPPLPNQPYMPPNSQQNQALMSNPPPLPNQPRPINLPQFTNQPPLPSQPPPVIVTSQPPPVIIPSQPPSVTSLRFSQENTPRFQNPASQNQFSQPPPFTTQPPLPSGPPIPSPQPVLQNPIPAQFQPPLPQTTVTPVTSTVSSMPMYVPTPVRLPPKWKSAKDAEGRTYYYHVKTRVSQWEPPLWEHQQQQIVQESESETESSDSDEEDSSSEDEQEEEKASPVMEEDEPEPVEMFNDDDLGCEELGDSPYEPETMELLEDIVEDTKKKRRDILVQERVISPRTAEEIPDKLDKRKIRELKEKLRREKALEKIRLKQKNKSKGRSGTSKCEADTSSDPGRKIKDAFRLNMAGVIVHYLNAYRKPECKSGRITNTEDFKHLARKLTHFVMLKELKHCRSVDELDCNDNVKHKARDFVKKYMAKFGPFYQRPSDDD